MDVQIASSDDNSITMLMEKTEASIANAIRRSFIAEVPVMGIDEVTIYENTSMMHDEYLSHRIGLIPLKTDLKAYKMPGDCCGGNCTSCSVELTLDEAGPKTVYSSDIKTRDQRVKPVSGKIPIVELLPGQRLRLEAKAILGKGEDHAKWNVGLAGYKYFPVLKADYRKLKDLKEIAAACPTEAIKVKAGKLEVDPVKCTACHECIELVGDETALALEHDKTSFVFTAETNGQMTAKEAMLQTIKTLEGKIKSMESQL